MIAYNTRFRKTGDMVYISHLDLMTLFRMAIRRAGLPFVLTKGFTPRVKISMPKALKLGKSSEDEEMKLYLMEELEKDGVKDMINSQLPEGIQLLDIVKM